MIINPCQCGCNELIIWKEEPFDLDNIAKIECPECGVIVWGCDEDSVADWNAHRYDDK